MTSEERHIKLIMNTCLELVSIEWGERITKLARAVMVRRQFSIKKELPAPADVEKLTTYVASELRSDELKADNFTRIVQLGQTRILLYNKRRSGEIDAIRLISYAGKSRNLDEIDESLIGELTKVEKYLLKSQDLMKVRGKGNRPVPVLIPNDLRKPLDFIASRAHRIEAGVPEENDYLFPLVSNKSGFNPARSYESMKKICTEISLLAPSRITSVSMRKYTATLTQIDNQVLLTMEDSDLKPYLPAHGDRLAAYAFCRTLEAPQSEANDPTVGSRLLDSVRGKIRKKRHLGSSSGTQLEYKSGRKKADRRIELGWVEFDNITGGFKQIRATQGGGTRHLSVARDMNKSGIMEIGKQLFFPDGISKRGVLSNFKFSVRDFRMMDVGESSVTDLYENHKVKLLRLYICTEKMPSADCTPIGTTEPSSSTPKNLETLPDMTPTGTAGGETIINMDQEFTDEPTGTPTVVFNRGAAWRRRLRLQNRAQTITTVPTQMTPPQLDGTTEPQKETTEGEQLDAGPATINEVHVSTQQRGQSLMVSLGTSDLEAGISDSLSCEQDDDELPIFDTSSDSPLLVTAENESQLQKEIDDGFNNLSDLLTGEQELHINRENAAAELLSLYEDRGIMCRRVKVVFKGESGDDFWGLTKDLYTVAWKTILEEYFTGEDSMIPYVPLHRQRKLSKQYISIGRILSHSAALVKEIPARISRCTLIQLVFGPDGVGDDILMQDFRLFLPPVERHLISKALSRFSTLSEKESSTLLTVFSVHGLLEIPREAEIKDQVLAIARNNLVLKPSPFLTLMKKGIPETHLDVFWSRLTNDAISYIYNKQIPTPSKLVAVIKPEGDLKAEEEASIHYLQQYLCSLDSEELSNFLIFVTGSSSIPDKITVSFTSLTGLSRRPIAHTCSNLLELPATYSSVQDLKREFKKILSNESSFQMNMF